MRKLQPGYVTVVTLPDTSRFVKSTSWLHLFLYQAEPGVFCATLSHKLDAFLKIAGREEEWSRVVLPSLIPVVCDILRKRRRVLLYDLTEMEARDRKKDERSTRLPLASFQETFKAAFSLCSSHRLCRPQCVLRNGNGVSQLFRLLGSALAFVISQSQCCYQRWAVPGQSTENCKWKAESRAWNLSEAASV